MKNYFSKIGSGAGQLAYIIGAPLFFLTFVIGYRPEDMVAFFGMDGTKMALNLPLLMCIELGVLMLSRGALFVVFKKHCTNWFRFGMWVCGELVVSALFMALYMSLMAKCPYFYAVGMCLGLLIAVEIFPYSIITMFLCLLAPTPEEVKEKESLVRFYDSTQKLKFILSAPSLLYLEAAENYINVYYTEGETIKTYSLRSSMKALEPLMQKHRLVRCQRSYYINPSRVKALRRDKDGFLVADMNVDGCKSIPVSAMYQEELTKYL